MWHNNCLNKHNDKSALINFTGNATGREKERGGGREGTFDMRWSAHERAANLTCGRDSAPLTFTSVSAALATAAVHIIHLAVPLPGSALLHALNNNWAQVRLDWTSRWSSTSEHRQCVNENSLPPGHPVALALHLWILNEVLSSWKTFSLLIFLDESCRYDTYSS